MGPWRVLKREGKFGLVAAMNKSVELIKDSGAVVLREKAASSRRVRVGRAFSLTSLFLGMLKGRGRTC